MNPLPTPVSNPDDGPRLQEARCDARRQDIVDDAIALMRAAGTLSALEYLKTHAINAQVITRVLLEPGRRRGSQDLSTV